MNISIVILMICSAILRNITAEREVDQFENFGPVRMTFCDRVIVPSTRFKNAGGTICGDSGRIQKLKRISKHMTMISTSKIGLMSVTWTRDSLKNYKLSPRVKNYFKYCKPYMVQIYDAVYNNKETSCAFTTPKLSYEPQCNVRKDVMLRFGSGYCMKEQVCGAKIPIYFMTPPNSKDLSYVWETKLYQSLIMRNYTVVDVCFGFANIPNPKRRGIL